MLNLDRFSNLGILNPGQGGGSTICLSERDSSHVTSLYFIVWSLFCIY